MDLERGEAAAVVEMGWEAVGCNAVQTGRGVGEPSSVTKNERLLSSGLFRRLHLSAVALALI